MQIWDTSHCFDTFPSPNLMFREGMPEMKESPREKNERLWKNPEMVTVSFRRHSKYDSSPDAALRGALSQEGIELARQAAKAWADHAKLVGVQRVSVYESPSSMALVKGTGESTKKVFPARARITASTYEKAIFGNLAAAHRNEKGEMQSDRRKREELLGDLMETATNFKAIPDFFKARAIAYGKDMERFWHDYATGHLDPAVQSALEACGASTGPELAKRFTQFLSEVKSQAPEEDTGQQAKQVGIAITHGETMESFLYTVDQFRKAHGDKGENLYRGMMAYNEGFDAHLGKDGKLTIVLDNTDPITVDLVELQKFLTRE